MSSPLVSIIVPVYGVERYLEACVSSIVNQTYPHFEVLLIDDCSPDACPVLCDQLAKTDDRIRVIHKQQNEGLGFARNTGLDHASGEFILFVDSDDTIEPTLLESVLPSFDNDTEMVVFGIHRVHENVSGDVIETETLLPQEAIAHTPHEVADLFAMLNRERVFPFAWNKLYRRSFLEQCGTRFEKTKLIEDFLFNIALFKEATAIKTVSAAFYNYRKPAHETLASAYSPDFFDLCKRKYLLEKEFLKTVDAETDDNRQLICHSYVKHLISVFIKNRSKKAAFTPKQQIDKIRDVLCDDVTESVLALYRPQGIVMKIVTLLLKKKWATLTFVAVAVGAKYI